MKVLDILVEEHYGEEEIHVENKMGFIFEGKFL